MDDPRGLARVATVARSIDRGVLHPPLCTHTHVCMYVPHTIVCISHTSTYIHCRIETPRRNACVRAHTQHIHPRPRPPRAFHAFTHACVPRRHTTPRDDDTNGRRRDDDDDGGDDDAHEDDDDDDDDGPRRRTDDDAHGRRRGFERGRGGTRRRWARATRARGTTKRSRRGDE